MDGVTIIGLMLVVIVLFAVVKEYFSIKKDGYIKRTFDEHDH